MVLVGELDQLMQVAGAEHPGLINDQCCSLGEPPPLFGWTVWSGPFMDEFGDSVARHFGLAFQCSGHFGCW